MSRIERINHHLREIGSRATAVSETRILLHVGGLVWLAHDFESGEDMEAFVCAIPKEVTV